MADVPPTNTTTSLPAAADPPWLAARVELSVTYSAMMAIPVSIFCAIVSGYAVYYSLQLLLGILVGARPFAPNIIVFVLTAIAAIASGVLTIWYHLVNADVTFTKARLSGQLSTHKPFRCQSCQALLVMGQVVCDGCGQDLRKARHSGLPSLGLRREMLLSHLLGTIPVANVTLLMTFVTITTLAPWYHPRPSIQTGMALNLILFAVPIIVIALRVPRALFLWRLFRAEKLESGN